MTEFRATLRKPKDELFLGCEVLFTDIQEFGSSYWPRVRFTNLPLIYRPTRSEMQYQMAQIHGKDWKDRIHDIPTALLNCWKPGTKFNVLVQWVERKLRFGEEWVIVPELRICGETICL